MSDEIRAALAGLVLNKSPWVTGHNNKARCWHCGGWQDRGGHAADCPWEAARHALSASAPATAAGEQPSRCPVCGGNGLVASGFYAQTTGVWMTTGTAFEKCRSCDGQGIVWRALTAPADAREAGRERVKYCAEHGAVPLDHACGALPADAYKAFSEWVWMHDSRAEPLTHRVCFLAGWRAALTAPADAREAGRERVIYWARRYRAALLAERAFFGGEVLEAWRAFVAAVDALDGTADARPETGEPVSLCVCGHIEDLHLSDKERVCAGVRSGNWCPCSGYEPTSAGDGEM